MVRTVFPDISVGYKFSKRFSTAIHYRYQYINDGMENFSFQQSVLLDATYKLKFNKLTTGLRFRTGTIEDVSTSNSLFHWESWETREKLFVNYNLKKKREIFASCELFQLPVDSWYQLKQLRISAGFEFSISKAQKFGIGIMFQNRPAIKRINPLIAYSIDIDKLKKK